MKTDDNFIMPFFVIPFFLSFPRKWESPPAAESQLCKPENAYPSWNLDTRVKKK